MRNAAVSHHTANFERRPPRVLGNRAPAEFDELIRAQHELFERSEAEAGEHHTWVRGAALVPIVAVCIAAGFVGAVAIDPVHPYGALEVPPGLGHPYRLAVPMAAIFGLAGLAAWLAFRRRRDDLALFVDPALSVFRVVPMLAVLWTVSLHGLYSPIISLGAGILLVGAVIVTMLRFVPLSRAAALLLLPALAAATSATIFSGVMIRLNLDAPLLALQMP